MSEDGVTLGPVHATTIVEGRVLLTLADGTACEVLVPAGVGVPGATDEEFAAALAAELLSAGRTLPPVLDSSAVVASDPALYAAVAGRMESSWEQEA